MPPSLTDEYKRRLVQKQNKIKVIDLRQTTNPAEVYICEHCDMRLIPYHDIKGERLTRGKLWQCGKCGQIKDTEMDNIQRPATLITKGDNQDIFIKNFRQQPLVNPKQQSYDPEPMNDEILKGQGFHIVRTRVMSGDGKVLRDDSQT